MLAAARRSCRTRCRVRGVNSALTTAQSKLGEGRMQESKKARVLKIRTRVRWRERAVEQSQRRADVAMGCKDR